MLVVLFMGPFSSPCGVRLYAERKGEAPEAPFFPILLSFQIFCTGNEPVFFFRRASPDRKFLASQSLFARFFSSRPPFSFVSVFFLQADSGNCRCAAAFFLNNCLKKFSRSGFCPLYLVKQSLRFRSPPSSV